MSALRVISDPKRRATLIGVADPKLPAHVKFARTLYQYLLTYDPFQYPPTMAEYIFARRCDRVLLTRDQANEIWIQNQLSMIRQLESRYQHGT